MRQRGGNTRAVVLDEDFSSSRLKAEIRANIAPGSTICTDEYIGYRKLAGYTHLTVKHKARQYVDGMAHTNGIESVWAVLKRGYHGIYHHFTVKHMQRYVDEAAFRLNEGNCKIHTLDRIASLSDKTVGVRLTYKTLIA
jgi:ISXO2-like transposase domain